MKSHDKTFDAKFYSGGGIEINTTRCVNKATAFEEVYEFTADDVRPGYVNLPIGTKSTTVVIDFGGIELRMNHDDRRELIRLLQRFDEKP